MKPDELAERILEFAARIGKVVDALPETKLGKHIANQLVRCGTSPNANYEEACAAESRKDFIHKLGVCLKELRESRGWLKLIIRSELLPDRRMESLLEEASALCNIIAQSILTARQNAPKKPDPT
jgi:four helix bundle protein